MIGFEKRFCVCVNECLQKKGLHHKFELKLTNSVPE